MEFSIFKLPVCGGRSCTRAISGGSVFGVRQESCSVVVVVVVVVVSPPLGCFSAENTRGEGSEVLEALLRWTTVLLAL